jgi:hypothetical protein
VRLAGSLTELAGNEVAEGVLAAVDELEETTTGVVGATKVRGAMVVESEPSDEGVPSMFGGGPHLQLFQSPTQ